MTELAKAFPRADEATYYVDSGAHDVAALPFLEMERSTNCPSRSINGAAQRDRFFWQNYLEAGAVGYDNLTHAKFLERGY